jgi:hypothetical protein
VCGELESGERGLLAGTVPALTGGTEQKQGNRMQRNATWTKVSASKEFMAMKGTREVLL